jgi:hypothetical protein
MEECVRGGPLSSRKAGDFLARVVRVSPDSREACLYELRAVYMPVWNDLAKAGLLHEMQVIELTRIECSEPESPPWQLLLLAELEDGIGATRLLDAEGSQVAGTRGLSVIRSEVLSSTPASFYPRPSPDSTCEAPEVTYYIEFIGVEGTRDALMQYQRIMRDYVGPANGRLIEEGLLCCFVALETSEVLSGQDVVPTWNQLHVSADYCRYADMDWDAVYDRLYQRMFSRDVGAVLSELPEIPQRSDYSGRFVSDLHVR